MLPTPMEAVALMQGWRSHKWLTTSCILLCIECLLGACSQATGPYFRPAEHLPPGQTMVYLYFPNQSGHSDSYTILTNGATVTRLDDGSYYPFRTAPGRMIFSLPGDFPLQQVNVFALT